MSQTKIKKELIDASFGTDWVETIQTSNFTAAAGKGYFVDTTSAEITVTLPIGVVGTEIVIQDYAGTFATNKVILNANGSEKIQGSALEGQITTNNATAVLIYQDATKGWTSQDITINLPPLTVSYLVVAGGGGGGAQANSGGGGAGGYRNSYLTELSGGGQSSETPLTLSTSTDYTVTIGSGGLGATTSSTNGTAGSNSVFSTITSIGGGYGGHLSNSGGSGGSGGGGGYSGSNSGGSAVTSPVIHGYSGGSGGPSGAANYGAGGGGGAGGAGSAGTSSASGDGGLGLASSITGASATRASGGAGGGNADTPQVSAGGGSNNQSNATANTGGGGGGASNLPTPATSIGRNGGSGVVILRYPSVYTITVGAGITQSSGSPFTEGSDKVSVFTAGTGNIQFN